MARQSDRETIRPRGNQTARQSDLGEAGGGVRADAE